MNALTFFKDAFFVFTGINADTSYSLIETGVRGFIKSHKNAVLVKNFGSQDYLSMLSYAQIMIGNSSSGIIEAPSFRLPVVNIGTRQEGRVRAANVIDVGYGTDDIRGGIKRALSSKFCKTLHSLKNPYFKPSAAETIADTLCSADLKALAVKKFKDAV